MNVTTITKESGLTREHETARREPLGGRGTAAAHALGVPLPDPEGAQPFRLLSLHDDVRDHGMAGPALCPVQQLLHILAGPFENGLDPAVLKVAHPPAHPMQDGHPLARIPKINALHPPRYQHPKTDHS